SRLPIRDSSRSAVACSADEHQTLRLANRGSCKMSPTRRQMVSKTRARVIDTATRLTRERGPDGFSMDVLAEESGVARATVYEHFGSKRSVLDAVVWSESNTITLDLARNPEADPLRALRDALGIVCRHWAETEERMRGLRTLNAFTGTEPANDGIHEAQLRQLVEALANTHQLRAHWSVEEATDMLATMTSYSTYEQLRRSPRTPEQVESVLAKAVVAIVNP